MLRKNLEDSNIQKKQKEESILKLIFSSWKLEVKEAKILKKYLSEPDS